MSVAVHPMVSIRKTDTAAPTRKKTISCCEMTCSQEAQPFPPRMGELQ